MCCIDIHNTCSIEGKAQESFLAITIQQYTLLC